MESRAKVMGHPVHPMLIVFPLGLLTFAVVLDVLYFIFDNSNFALAAYYSIIGGLIGGLLAAIFGAIDWAAIPSGTRAKRVGTMHGIGNVVVVLLFVVSWWLRRDQPDYVPTTLAFVLALAGIGLSLLTGWLGAELIYRLRVSVDHGAHLDAPNSLSGQPASTNQEVTTERRRYDAA
jgi:uncharacterized membrane protein